MSKSTQNNIFTVMNRHEISACLFFNKMSNHEHVRILFSTASWLGNGFFWYLIAILLLIFTGIDGIYVALHMFTVGLVALLFYMWIKKTIQRVRPYQFSKKIHKRVAVLDTFSFPSGHSMHAVSFTVILMSYHSSLWLILISFTMLVILSRVILGVHYLSDVLAGAIIGISLSMASIFLLKKMGNILSLPSA